MVFSCIGITNQGRICEHDVFALLEQFKEKESFFFYKELISRKDVPRDYKKIVDESDNIFFKAFAQDLIKISQIITLKKRILGIEDTDTNKGIEYDFDPNEYHSHEQLEADLCQQVQYLLGLIGRKTNTTLHQETADIMLKSKSI